MRFVERYIDYYEDFLLLTTYNDSEVYDWRPGVHNELVVYLHNGDVLSYNCMSHDCVRVIKGVRDDDVDVATDEDFGVRFSTNLKRIMNKRFMTQRELAEKSGLTILSVNKYVNGHATPSFDSAVKLADALNCTVSDLAYLE